MRTTVTVPDEFYKDVKASLLPNGYATFNELILDLLRHHQGQEKDIPQVKGKRLESKGMRVVMGKSGSSNECRHGFTDGFCKYGC